MQKVLADGTVVKGISPFWEYAYVQKNTEDLERLKWLYDTRLTRTETAHLLGSLSLAHGFNPPAMRWTNRTDRGFYSFKGYIRLRPSYISAEVAVHELAHHWTYLRCGEDAHHNWDFVWRLDELAATAKSLLTDSYPTGSTILNSL